jgi:hypothetical protein
MSLSAFFFSVSLSIFLSLSSLTLFCFVLHGDAALSYLTSSLYLLLSVNLRLVSIKYKNPKNIFLLFTVGNIPVFITLNKNLLHDLKRNRKKLTSKSQIYILGKEITSSRDHLCRINLEI